MKQLEIKIPDQDFVNFFLDSTTEDEFLKSYDSSGKHTNLYDMMKFSFFNPITKLFGMHYSVLGCKMHLETITIKQNEVYTLDLTGVIGNGELLYINYTPQSESGQCLQPVELHGNQPLTNTMRKVIRLISYSDKTYPQPIETKVSVFIYYAPVEIKEDLSTSLILDAFKYFQNDDYRYAIISAQTAVEIEVTNYLDRLPQIKNIDKRAAKYLGDINSIHRALFGVMPLLSSLLNFPLPNEKIMNNARFLIDLRNSLIHNGTTKNKDFSVDKVEDCLLSAFYLYKYFKLDIPNIPK